MQTIFMKQNCKVVFKRILFQRVKITVSLWPSGEIRLMDFAFNTYMTVSCRYTEYCEMKYPYEQLLLKY